MEWMFEIYFIKKKISREDWEKLIDVISNYVGFFKKWNILIIYDQNKIRYFIKCRCKLLVSINEVDFCLFKRIDNINILREDSIIYPFFWKIGSNIVDIINWCEIKNKGVFTYLEITLRKIWEDKIQSKIIFGVKKKQKLKRYRVLLGLPISILAVDFRDNQRYFYQKVPKYLDISKVINLFNCDSSLAILKIDAFPYLQKKIYLKQNYYDFDKHSIILGSSGSGKSKFISSFIWNLYQDRHLRNKYKVVVIDPHCSLEDDIGGIGKVIDFKRQEDTIDLFINKNDDFIASTELLVELLSSFINGGYNSKLERVLRHSITILLINKSFSFSNLRKLLLDLEYRNSLIKKLRFDIPTSIIDFFLSDYNDLKTKSYSEAIGPIISFVDEMEMIPVFNHQFQNDNLEMTIENNFLTLFSLDRIKLGDHVTQIIAGLIMQQLLTIIQSNVICEHIILIVDEVAIIQNDILSRFLSEARKYHLSLILAGQYFNQISEKLKYAIFANIMNYYIFRVSKLDASILVDHFDIKIPLDNTREQKIKLLMELQNRECVVRLSSNDMLFPAFRGMTMDFTSIPRVKSKIDREKDFPFRKRKKEIQFQINSNVKLQDILIKNSTKKDSDDKDG